MVRIARERVSTIDVWRRVFEHAAKTKVSIVKHTTKATFDTICWSMLWSVVDGDLDDDEKIHALHHLSRMAVTAIEDGVVSKRQLQMANPIDLRLPDDLVEWLEVWDDYSGSPSSAVREVPEA